MSPVAWKSARLLKEDDAEAIEPASRSACGIRRMPKRHGPHARRHEAVLDDPGLGPLVAHVARLTVPTVTWDCTAPVARNSCQRKRIVGRTFQGEDVVPSPFNAASMKIGDGESAMSSVIFGRSAPKTARWPSPLLFLFVEAEARALSLRTWRARFRCRGRRRAEGSSSPSRRWSLCRSRCGGSLGSRSFSLAGRCHR